MLKVTYNTTSENAKRMYFGAIIRLLYFRYVIELGHRFPPVTELRIIVGRLLTGREHLIHYDDHVRVTEKKQKSTLISLFYSRFDVNYNPYN